VLISCDCSVYERDTSAVRLNLNLPCGENRVAVESQRDAAADVAAPGLPATRVASGVIAEVRIIYPDTWRRGTSPYLA
jgi:hypothetical protein